MHTHTMNSLLRALKKVSNVRNSGGVTEREENI